jgi:BirA family biotin operon repressor/biotin-[acetyl-CoA-carboxylase] ligase
VIAFVPETVSTNTDLVARLRAGENVPAGYWLVVDRQTGGRGRQGRQWNDAPGNFMGSTVVQLQGRDASTTGLALVAGLALYETVLPRLNMPGELQLKWPNDLLLSGAKLAGILLEREGDAVVVGFGVNLASAPRVPGRNTVSLGQFGPAPDRDSFAADLVVRFEDEVARWRTYGIDPVLARWRSVGHPEGTLISVHGDGGEPVMGIFAGLAPDGALRLNLADGSLRVIHAGEVLLEGS